MNHLLHTLKYHQPFVANLVSRVALGPTLDYFKKAGIPFFASQDKSARALHALFRYARFRSNSK